MKTLIIIVLLFATSFTLLSQNSKLPDLNKKEDLKALGIGKIVEKDNTSIRDIGLVEVKELSIVYVKRESLHDLYLESIRRLEFPNSKWGRLQIEFVNNIPVIKPMP